MKCPPISRSLVIADDARLAAQMSCALARPGYYLPIIEGPRMSRTDHEAEVVRRNNAASRAKPDAIFLTGLSDDSINALKVRFASRLQSKIRHIATSEDVNCLYDDDRLSRPPVIWGRDRIGIGLLKALRARSSLAFEDKPSPVEAVPSKSTHLVVCEEGNDLAQVIAANYAYALRAGLCLIPEVDEQKSDELLESFYSLYDERRFSQTESLERLKEQLRDLCGPLPVPVGGSITFVTGGLPFGFSASDFPSTHLFKYPDLGIAVINGFAAEQPDTLGIGFVALVDPATTEAQEIAVAEKLMPPRGAFVRTYYGAGANVRHVTEMMELFPYDLLIIATHCGDSEGYRWTYEYKDSEGIDRVLVVDIAIGVARTDDDNMLKVTQFMRFVSLDGVDWNDPQKAKKLNVGTAILDFMDRTRDVKNELKPVKKDTVPRVLRSAALKMHDQNLIVLPRPLAGEGTPIIINNACASWHRLAKDFTFCNARAYVGTLFPVTPSEAQEMVVKLLDKHFGKPLAAALWSAHREVYGSGVRRPYIVTGVYPQRLRVKRHDLIERISSRLARTLVAWKNNLARVDSNDGPRVKMVEETVAYYEQQVAHFRNIAGE
jgi:hypothetical protein